MRHDNNLTLREAALLDLVAAGLTNRQIARRLEISERTVRNHLSTIFPKIGAADRTQAAIYALAAGRRVGAAGPESGPGAPCAPELTERETAVLGLIAAGLTNRQIARRLEISEKTVKNHLSTIFPKIGAANRTQAAIYATWAIRRPAAKVT